MKTPQHWYEKNKGQLKQYRGQWIAYDSDGIIAHHAKYEKNDSVFTPRSTDYLIGRIYETEFVEPVKFYPIRFKILKKHEWQPKYPVTLQFQITYY
jgi:hypothetical protein